MSDGPTFDFTAFDRLAVDLGAIPASAGPNLRKAGEVFARNVKDSWRSKVSGARALGGLAPAVSYDLKGNAGATSALEIEIGFDKGRGQGPLGNVSEFGTPKVAPRGYGLASLQENEGDLAKGIDLALRAAEKAAGL